MSATIGVQVILVAAKVEAKEIISFQLDIGLLSSLTKCLLPIPSIILNVTTLGTHATFSYQWTTR